MNIILEFLEAYKSLDELCKQILASDRGISKYIDEMDYESQGHMRVACWEKDYRQLKKMRYIRNKLVHEANSFQDNLVSVEDIEWLENFQSRIMNCTDPFSLLYQSRSIRRATAKPEKHIKKSFKTNEPSHNWNFAAGVSVLIGIIVLVIICSLTIRLINLNL